MPWREEVEDALGMVLEHEDSSEVEFFPGDGVVVVVEWIRESAGTRTCDGQSVSRQSEIHLVCS